MKCLLPCLLFGLFAISCARKEYNGYKVIKTTVTTTKQLVSIQHLIHDDKYDFWREPRRVGEVAEILVSSREVSTLNVFLRKHGFQFSTLIENMGEQVTQQMDRLNERREPDGRMSYDFNDYNDYDAMIEQLEYFAGNCTEPLSCSLVTIGDTFEGRLLHQLIVTTSPDDDTKMGFWFDSLIHAREWLAGTSVMNMINHMLSEYSLDDEVTYLLDTYDFYFVPIMNPDGYVHSWDVDRFWRKSRNINEESECMGTDLNRNYDNSWGTDGTSTLACSDTYGGSSAGSEPETQAIQTRSTELSSRLHAFVTVHTAANMWLHPLGNTLDGGCEYSADHEHQYQVAEAAANATMAEYDTIWTYGNTCETIYPASGITQDYAYAQAGIKYSFTPELRGPGFDPEPEHIEPGWMEFWAGVKAMIAEIENIEGVTTIN